jgi:Zn finger protein HypA/HybF involved in hydrogenase expression
MTAARRCSTCGIDWPNHNLKYKVCPKCEGSLFATTSGTPMPEDEALSLKRHCEFDHYCQKRDYERLAAEKH